jgi:murein DD-endopeptidase MepM/ murein hydrolase activator NlpD
MRPLRVVVTVVVIVVLCCGGVAVTGAAMFTSTAAAASQCGGTGALDPDAELPTVADLTGEQLRNAAVITAVGQQLGVPPRGWVIAVATALQESRLRNLGDLGEANDHDSLGLFQQRPSQGWGTPAQIMDPAYAAGKFYTKLLTVPNWQTRPLTEAAQAVQVSAYPDAYARHEPLATTVVNALADGAGSAAGAATDLHCAQPGEITASGWTIPVRGPVVSGFRTPGRPTHHGVDIAVPKGTVIRAATSGIVRTARCNATLNGAPYSCDTDGSPTVRGCGWYVDIDHADGILTRYCHMIQRPDVTVGQTVAAGQPIGLTGSSGNSSGPHLHYEIHTNRDSSSAGATNPETFMKDKGAALGV